MYKNVIMAIMALCLLCGASARLNSRWASFPKDKTMFNREKVTAIFETSKVFGETYEERQKNKPQKCVQVLIDGQSFYMTDTSYKDIKEEILR